MKKLLLIALMFCACKTKSLDIVGRIKSINSAVRQIKYSDSLEFYEWSESMNPKTNLKHTFYAYSIGMDSKSKELQMAVLRKTVPYGNHALFFKEGKLIKAETEDDPLSDTASAKEYYFENGKLLNSTQGLRKDSIEKFYHDLSDSSLKFRNEYLEKLKNKQ